MLISVVTNPGELTMSIFDSTPAQESNAAPGALRVVMFVFCLALFIGGFYLMSVAFEHASGILFGAAMLLCGLAYIIPTTLMSNLD